MAHHETQYELSQGHLTDLARNIARLAAALQVYIDSDHHSSNLDSPFMLEMNETLLGLNVQVERLIQRVDPGYPGTYTGEE